jgi:Ca2+-binding EF-hand superfamily protein
MGANALSEDQIASVQEAFMLFYADGNGRISCAHWAVTPRRRSCGTSRRRRGSRRPLTFVADLRHVLTSVGEKLEPHEFDE